ncbi:hypothetical protein NMY22_g16006 [Coprinellus aureogranulatus]|nr:hypothetical protein NMY22_g16006 [Coprinellus aureogranulatus]
MVSQAKTKNKKLKISSCTPNPDSHYTSQHSRHAAEKSDARRKMKSSSYTRGLYSTAAQEHSAAVARTLPTSKLKTTGVGLFRVCNARTASGVAVPNVRVNDPRATEDILEDWLSKGNNYGWDEAYINSFVENDLPPPTEDPELVSKPTQTTGKGDMVMHEWEKELDTYLRIIITLEGRGSNPPFACEGECRIDHPSCSGAASFRCLSCNNGGLLCLDCMTRRHYHTPLHRIEKWNGTFFKRTTLKSLGLRIQLGHPPGHTCDIPEKAWNDDFVIIDRDMIHSVGLDFCNCGYTSKSPVEQLLERRLYPATIVNPKTAATFRALEMFEILQYESKLSPYEFYKAVSRLTDNTGLHTPKDRYPSLLRMVHQWRHTRLMKRSGKGHHPDGVASTTQGECALLCPPCPHPGINMPEGWENEPEATRYIHSLNVGLDANYRLKRKDVSSDEADPGLSKGFAYFVNDIPFREHLRKHEADVEPKSTCSRHDAVNLADVRPGQGYAATGVATVECTRHNMKRPSGVCDLQKGERYNNMDYIFGMSLIIFGLSFLRTFLVSYDIACQWSKALFSRIAEITPGIPILKDGSQTRFVVPKFHLPAHIPNCQTRYAFMFTPGAGLGDGEAPERGWADSNPLGPSTREMGPGTRRDTLDFHFGNYNWVHITNLGASLLKKMDVATSGVAERIIAHKDFEEGLDDADVEKWKRQVIEWEQDPNSVPNPFDMTIAAPSQYAVRREFATEDAALLATGKDFSLTSDMSPSHLICRGLDLESEMRSLKESMKKTWDHSRDRELTRVQLKANTIVRKVDAWYRTLQLFIPSTILLREECTESSKTVKAYDLPLWLPSQIGRRAPVDRGLYEIEFKLRNAQAQDALSTIRRNLQRRVTVWDLKDRWLRGQKQNTKALNLLSTLQQKIQTAKTEYSQAREALLTLAPILGKKDVEKLYLPLADEHLRPLQAESARTAPSAGQTREAGKSWIWNHPGASLDKVSEYEAEMKKIEWAKSRARSLRYQEEVQIVKEEMNRTVRFFMWKERDWRKRADAKEMAASQSAGADCLTSEHAEGLKAYAERQASICREMRDSFIKQWTHVDSMIKMAAMEAKDPKLLFARMERERAKLLSKPVTRAGLDAATRPPPK